MLAIESRAGDPIAAGAVRLVPVVRSWRLKLGAVGLAWTRPAGMLVESRDGETAVPIRDWTRRWQLAILGAGLVGSLALWLRRPRRRNRSPREAVG